ncbi:MAG TPA: SLC13 family permease [Terriglobia bacterium]|nr:SLC13 family permease [Terriglobia bacterium]
MSAPAASLVHSAEAQAAPRSATLRYLASAAAVLILLLLWFLPLGLEEQAQRAIAIASFMVVLWVTELVPHAITGLIGCWLFWALGVAPVRTAFAGFSVSEAPWFLLGALLIGTMVTESGLARRVAYAILAHVGTSFSRVLLAFLITNFLMTFMVPAGPPRVILLGSIALGAVASYGLSAKSNIATALILAVTFSATLNDKTILGSTPAILARSLIVEHGHVPVYWSQWLIAYAPLGIANLLLVWWLTLRLYPPEVKDLPGGPGFLRQRSAELGPWTAREKRAAFWILAAVALWLTDFLHHVSPAIIGLGVGLATVLPGVGALTTGDLKKVNFYIILFMGTALSMAEVLRDTGAVRMLSDMMFAVVSPWVQSTLDATVFLYWSAFLAHLLLASETSMISVTMPVIMDLSLRSGLDPLAVGLIWSFATGGKLFIYQSLVLIAGYAFGCYSARDVAKIGAFFLIVQWALLLLIVPFYWPLLGIG